MSRGSCSTRGSGWSRSEKGAGLFSASGWHGALGGMPRPRRVCPAREVFHVLNRSVARLTIFEKPGDFEAFFRVLEETWREVPMKALRHSVRRGCPFGESRVGPRQRRPFGPSAHVPGARKAQEKVLTLFRPTSPHPGLGCARDAFAVRFAARQDECFLFQHIGSKAPPFVRPRATPWGISPA